jgi:hypothetical protein
LATFSRGVESRSLDLGTEQEQNPRDLSEEMLLQATDLVQASIHGSNLRCTVAFRISDYAKIAKIAVGAMADKLGIQITNCQISIVKAGKTIHDDHEVVAEMSSHKSKAIDQSQQTS